MAGLTKAFCAAFSASVGVVSQFLRVSSGFNVSRHAEDAASSFVCAVI